MTDQDQYDLDRFSRAQGPVIESVIAELKAGLKRTHWMWFIFPQIDGLGFSSTTRYYAIKSEAEARQYLSHPILGPRLVKCAEILLSLEGVPAEAIFGYPDVLKLQSSMTLFACVAESESVFARVLEKYYGGKRDPKTLSILAGLST